MMKTKLSETYKKLIASANEVKEKAYAPYSKYKVGAAILAKSGKTYVGCNVENAAYGDTTCAERCAVSNAVADGCKPGEIEAIAVVSTGKNFSPCGSCRQVLHEFGDTIIVIFEFDNEIIVMPVSQLLPKGYKKNV